ncbi:2OG-Fe(II) oxygenase [Cupriavidus gilardii]|uniref:2-oxoglutarate-dependent dioxygenase n=1 Tax=Cupriavidus gilardii TaxID=82541 RepID=A0A6N1BN74_9BURK|nr:2OG-Fe(II) oxygenase [Cupriavidus gilardii]KAB0594762.1 2-oxoglutarate-dependent dioxygenase [Cupriavidus gilardii]MCT9012797.1 2OG-Fe(II) oxygenase [Cupriavidus gilardii]MCT9054763.1 2OG-Fe(II) oxygenase [Cupriavidus gilardii]MCT9073768.1 2OG-Fe(II) oxygenase [Cupriavidus gilardii]MCT9115324.1 2OG-Fe(II) oxygenase [Cupriavidus gilardii]
MTSRPHPQAGKAGYATSSPELERWLARHIAQGFGADALVRSMCQSGYDAAFARATVQAALAGSGERGARPGHSPSPGARPKAATDLTTSAARDGAAPAAAAITAPNALPAGDGRDVPVLFAMESPRIALFQRLLMPDECEALIALSRGRLARSPVVNPDTGDENLIDARTSMGAMFQVGEHPLIERLEARIAAVTGVPVEQGEGLQILNYKPGAEYQPHYDYFNPQRPGEARQLRVGGQRMATLVIYLNDVPAGGATAFPKLGLRVNPVQGNAVFFAYLGEDGALDERTLHAGLPVEQGEKWIATKWLREAPYRGEG